MKSDSIIIKFDFYLLQNYLVEAEGFITLYHDAEESSKIIITHLDETCEANSAILQNKLKTAYLEYQS